MTRLLLLAAALVGCKATPEAETVTFHADVAPILDANCMSCHASGGIGPMTFESYDETKQWAEAIVASTANRSMPPKQVRADGTCGDFDDAWWLSDEDLATLAAWTEGGMVEGEELPRNPAEPPPPIESTHDVRTPEFTPVLAEDGPNPWDEYRCFPVPIEDLETYEGGAYLTGFDVTPGTPEIVHHMVGYVVDPTADSRADDLTNAEQMALLDAQDDRPGWPCYAGAGSGVSYDSDPIAWAPGQGGTRLPEGTGIAVKPGSVMVMQTHYNLINPADVGKSDSTQLHMRFEAAATVTEPLIPVYVDFLLGSGNTLPMGEESYVYERSISLNELGVPIALNIVGIMPHMHGRGRQLNVSLVEPGGEEECVVQVDNWDYGWQFVYFYDNRKVVQPTDRVRVSCTYDTRDATAPVQGGWGTQDEMCLAVIYVSI